MAEVGCLKDGNFQNLEASNILLGSKSLVAPLSSQGKVIIDNISTITAAGDGDVTLTNTHMGSVYIISGTAGNNRKIILPSIDTVNAGSQILFVFTGTPDTSQITILTQNDEVFYGVIEVSVAANTDQDFSGTLKVAGQLPVSNLTDKSNGIVLKTGVAAADAGSRFLFTCIGGTSYTAVEGGADGDAATLTTGTSKVWLVEGNAVCDSAAPTGADIVGDAA